MDGEVTGHHPILHTALLGVTRMLGHALSGGGQAGNQTGALLYSFVQMIAMSLLYADVCRFLRQRRTPRWLQLGSLLFLGFHPVNGLMALCATLLLEAIFLFGGEFILGLFSRDAAVIAAGVDITWHIAPTFVLYICIEVLSGALRGTGDSLVPMIMTSVGVCLLRVIWILGIAPQFFGDVNGVLYSYPVSWGTTSLLFVIYYLQGGWLKRRKKAMGFPA